MGSRQRFMVMIGVTLLVLGGACSKGNEPSAGGQSAATSAAPTTKPSAATLDPCRLADASDVSPILGASATHDEGTKESCTWHAASGADSMSITLTDFDSPTKVSDYLTQNFNDETKLEGVGAIGRYNTTSGALTIGEGKYVIQVKPSTTKAPSQDVMTTLGKTMANNLLA